MLFWKNGSKKKPQFVSDIFVVIFEFSFALTTGGKRKTVNRKIAIGILEF